MENYNARYSRHYSLQDFGTKGQQKLEKAKVLVIGAGGLGCPVLQYLVASGIGTIGIVDHDIISLSNLQRQVLYTTDDIGKDKATVACKRLLSLNPEISITGYAIALSSKNAIKLIRAYDIIVDCTDNFASRYLINDACVLLEKPLVFGAIYQYEGQVAVFNIEDENKNKTNYRHLFPKPPKPDEVQNCNEAGVLGVLPGIIGLMQAGEVIKLLTGIGEVLVNRLLTFSLLNYELYVIEINMEVSVSDLIPKDEITFEATEYNLLCGLASTKIETLSVIDFLDQVSNNDTIVIDVREKDELPKADFKYCALPLSGLSEKIPEISERTILLFCQSGKRSLIAGALLLEKFGTTKKISHLKDGINALKELK